MELWVTYQTNHNLNKHIFLFNSIWPLINQTHYIITKNSDFAIKFASFDALKITREIIESNLRVAVAAADYPEIIEEGQSYVVH